jgi:hypothetical protein
MNTNKNIGANVIHAPFSSSFALLLVSVEPNVFTQLLHVLLFFNIAAALPIQKQ